jgi:hypothetical protein
LEGERKKKREEKKGKVVEPAVQAYGGGTVARMGYEVFGIERFERKRGRKGPREVRMGKGKGGMR